jgi:hypothetical protein
MALASPPLVPHSWSSSRVLQVCALRKQINLHCHVTITSGSKWIYVNTSHIQVLRSTMLHIQYEARAFTSH